MKIEKLRNNYKKEIIIGTILTVVIGGALTYKLTHSKYRVTQSIDLGSGVINYKVPDFKIMAIKISEDGTNYSDGDVVPTGDYIINEEKTYCQTSSGSEVKRKLYTNNSREHVFKNLTKGDKCYLYFDKKPITVDDIIASFGTVTEKSSFSTLATEDEGVFKAEDGMYGSTNTNKIYTYYWRGAATTNHVIFADKCWRIVRINGDKTMRLIYNGTIQSGNTCFGNGANANSIAVTSQAYNASHDQSNYVGWTYIGTSQRTTSGTASNAKTKTESWYTSNITGTKATKVADGKYCNDRNVIPGQSWVSTGKSFRYAGYDRLTGSNPTFDCPDGDVYTLKVGAITADEAAFAGGKYQGSNNLYYYLYNGQSYWTMTPFQWSSSSYAEVYYVTSSGYFTYNHVISSLGLRPVINLKSDVTFSSGDGTISEPYVVS